MQATACNRFFDMALAVVSVGMAAAMAAHVSPVSANKNASLRFEDLISAATNTDACHTNIVSGQFQLTQDGASETVYVAQSGSAWGSSGGGTSMSVSHNARAYVAQSCDGSFNPNTFKKVYLLGKTISVTVDLSSVGCGCNAAFYLVSMPASQPTQCGDYYCDANYVCGVGCPEMDLFEANNNALQVTAHHCSGGPGNWWACDGGGCAQNTYRHDPNAFGWGGGHTINTQQPFRVSVQFQAPGNTLTQIITTLSQSGRTVQMTHNGGNCGSLSRMSQALADGMAITASYWGDTASAMSWLDEPPCPSSVNCSPGGPVKFSNIEIE